MPGPYLALPAGHPIADPRSGILTPPWVIYFQHLTRDLGDSLRLPGGGGGGGGGPLPPVPPGFAALVAAAGYWTPITNGDGATPEILFDSAGEVIVGFVPTP